MVDGEKFSARIGFLPLSRCVSVLVDKFRFDDWFVRNWAVFKDTSISDVFLVWSNIWGFWYNSLMIVCNTSLICSGPGVFSSIRTTMSDDGDHTCPLCAEEMDITDQQLKPCKCGYDVRVSIISLSYQSVCTYLLSITSAPATTTNYLRPQATNCHLLN